MHSPMNQNSHFRVIDVSMLHERLMRPTTLPPGWSSSIVSGSDTSLVLCKFTSVQSSTVEVLYMLVISCDFTWTVRSGQSVVPKSTIFDCVPRLLHSIKAVLAALFHSLTHAKSVLVMLMTTLWRL